jgi:hypothetical protein
MWRDTPCHLKYQCAQGIWVGRLLILYCISVDGKHVQIDLKYKGRVWKNEKESKVGKRKQGGCIGKKNILGLRWSFVRKMITVASPQTFCQIKAFISLYNVL